MDLRPTEPGLGRNARLFALLVLLNGFVGLVVGTERALVPLLGEQVFGLASKTALLTFIATFGIVKAVSNLVAGSWSDVLGRRKLLLAGWLVGLPVPLLLMFAPPPHWWLIVLANALLGVNQGFCWSMAVVMKVDIAGERRRGLALGLNEFAGYVAVGLAALATGILAAQYGLRPVPFLLALGAVLAGLALTLLFVPETRHLAGPPASVVGETSALASGARVAPGTPAGRPKFRDAWVSLRRWTIEARELRTFHQAGLVNNLNDGVAWGLLPLLFAEALGDPARIGLLVALYPLAWGLLQLVTGPASDRTGRVPLIVGGMVLQAVALAALVVWSGYMPWLVAMVLYGAGTAMVYPTLLGAVADAVPGPARGAALGAYRFWRDLGFAVGALGGGLLADLAGLRVAVLATAAVTLLSGLHVAWSRWAASRRAPAAPPTSE